MSAGLRPVNDRDFDRVIASASVPVLVEFWKPGCGHCRALSVELERVQAHVGERLLVLSMNVEENHQIPAELEIRSVPALAMYRRGEFTGFVGGIGKKEEILKQLGFS
jgi:thioredoxin-like negative regulator of GroEL